jgi:hypothetical protein
LHCIKRVMLHRYSIVVVFGCMLAGVNWWAQSLGSQSVRDLASASLAPTPQMQSNKRRELLEVLDRLVSYQHYYRSVYGHFTKILNRVGVVIPRGISENYEIQIVEATAERLVIEAISEENGKVTDQVSIDQNYQLKANFKLPPPRPEFLRTMALKHLRTLRESPQGQSMGEPGVYRGYFHYEVKRDSQELKVALASGIRPPVLGLQLELGPQDVAPHELDPVLSGGEESAEADQPVTGQKPTATLMGTLEEAYLAQKIFRAEVGRYAKSWNELSQITDFRFEEKNRFPAGKMPFAAEGEAPGTVSPAPQKREEPAPQSPYNFNGLEIEPVSGIE